MTTFEVLVIMISFSSLIVTVIALAYDMSQKK
ncbi:putative holin-like toxin [Sporosarcina sp. FSL K6-3457]